MPFDGERKDAVARFLEYLRFRTISGEGPRGSYEQASCVCADWLRAYLEETGLSVKVFSPVANKPVVLATWSGSDPSLPGILLNSHYDVVPAMEEHWEHDPFDAQVLEDGRIYGRGAQDMKSVGIQYVEAVYRLKSQGFAPERNVHLLYVPDEEIGGVQGMKELLQHEEFKALQPIAFALDEGLANPEDAFTVFYGERTGWPLYVTATGPTGHGSRFIQNPATSKLVDVCDKLLTFRDEQEKLLHSAGVAGCKHGELKKRKLGDVTTVNLTVLQSGVSTDGGKTHALNVIPTTAVAAFDIRISPHTDLGDFKRKLDEWCAADGVSWDFTPWLKDPFLQHYTTPLDDGNVWWKLFRGSCQKLGVAIETEVFPAATDSRFLRQLGIPALGFSPMNNTEILLHEHNESLHKDVFLRGIDVYAAILTDLFAYAEEEEVAP